MCANVLLCVAYSAERICQVRSCIFQLPGMDFQRPRNVVHYIDNFTTHVSTEMFIAVEDTKIKCRLRVWWPNKSKPLTSEDLSIRLDFKIKFECKRSTKILPVSVKYFMRDLICTVINYCDSIIAMGKLLLNSLTQTRLMNNHWRQKLGHT